jgi:hypothetical protein
MGRLLDGAGSDAGGLGLAGGSVLVGGFGFAGGSVLVGGLGAAGGSVLIGGLGFAGGLVPGGFEPVVLDGCFDEADVVKVAEHPRRPVRAIIAVKQSIGVT